MNFEDFEGQDSVLLSLDTSEAIYVTRGMMGTGTWVKDPCENPDCESPECRAGGLFKVISLILRDVEGNEMTIIVPMNTQFSEVLLDPGLSESLRNNLED